MLESKGNVLVTSVSFGEGLEAGRQAAHTQQLKELHIFWSKLPSNIKGSQKVVCI